MGVKNISELEKIDKLNDEDLFMVRQKEKTNSISYNDIKRILNIPIVDNELSEESKNTIENKIVTKALNNKVEKVEGKGLSSEDYTKEEKDKLKGISEGATKVEIDEEITENSTNAVQGKAIYIEIGKTGHIIETSIDSTNYIMTIKLLDKSRNILSTSEIDLPLETMVVNARYNADTKEIVLILQNGTEVSFSVADLISGLVSENTFNTTVENLRKEIGEKADKSTLNSYALKTAIPKKTSELENDSNYVTNTDFATSNNSGVVKTGNGVQLDLGTLAVVTKTIEEYSNYNNTLFISKGTLENVLKERIGNIETVLDTMIEKSEV